MDDLIAEAESHEDRDRFICLCVHSANARAIELYERFGFWTMKDPFVDKDTGVSFERMVLELHSGEEGRIFTPGKSYTREEIHDKVGGDLESYLPNVGGLVVAACLRLDTNPHAPDVILVGTGPGIEGAADMLIAQQTPVPTFLKRGPGKWEYCGDYAVERWSTDAAELAAQAARSGRDDITRIIQMVKASTPASGNG